jgi:uncharacterized protein
LADRRIHQCGVGIDRTGIETRQARPHKSFRNEIDQALHVDTGPVIQAIFDWARAKTTIQAVAIVGSHARGTAIVNSDIDVVLLTTDPNSFRTHTAWLAAIAWDVVGARPTRWEDEDYGALWSRRVWLEQNVSEIEFGFASPLWADVNPLDPGTRQVIADGCRILHDPYGLLRRLCAAVAREPAPLSSLQNQQFRTNLPSLEAIGRSRGLDLYPGPV